MESMTNRGRNLFANLMAIFLFVALTVFFISAVKADTLVVHDNMGGNLGQFAQHSQTLKQLGIRVAIAGECYSACTLYLNVHADLNVCITPDALLGFHKPFAIQDGQIVHSAEHAQASEIIWQTIYKMMPERIQTELDRGYIPSVYQGDNQEDLYYIGYEVLKEIYPTCN